VNEVSFKQHDKHEVIGTKVNGLTCAQRWRSFAEPWWRWKSAIVFSDYPVSLTRVLNLKICLSLPISSVSSTRSAGRFMTDARVVAESVFDRNRRRDAEINEALKNEAARHETAVKNMQRLRALRLARDAKLNKGYPERQK
jgi:hypothetical protein